MHTCASYAMPTINDEVALPSTSRERASSFIMSPIFMHIPVVSNTVSPGLAASKTAYSVRLV